MVFVDRYGPCEGPVPESFSRTFEVIEMEHSHDWEVPSGLFGRPGPSGRVERAGRGELEGGEVLFTRGHDEEEEPLGLHEASYEAALVRDPSSSEVTEDPDPDDERLADLVASADLTELLPWREVAVGDHWYVDVGAFHELCWPSGKVGYLDVEGDHLVVPVDERLGQNLDGTLRVELAAIQRLDGVRYALLEFRGRLESSTVFVYEWVFEVMGGTYRSEGPIGLELDASLDGYLWWNLEDGHLDSVELEGHVTVLHRLSGLDAQFAWEGWSLMAEVLGDEREWLGELTASARFERL